MVYRVVNSYAAASDCVSVTLFSNELFPTLGKPIKATRPSPDFATSNPPCPPPDDSDGVINYLKKYMFKVLYELISC